MPSGAGVCRRGGLAGLLLVGLLSSHAARPSEARVREQYAGIPLPPYEFYEALLGLTEAGDFDGLRRAMRHLSPLFSTLRERFGRDVEAELALAALERDGPRALAAVLRIILLDMRLNLLEALEADAEGRNAFIQMAYMDYRFLAVRLESRDRALGVRVRTDFKTAFRARDRAVFAARVAQIMEAVSPDALGIDDDRA